MAHALGVCSCPGVELVGAFNQGGNGGGGGSDVGLSKLWGGRRITTTTIMRSLKLVGRRGVAPVTTIMSSNDSPVNVKTNVKVEEVQEEAAAEVSRWPARDQGFEVDARIEEELKGGGGFCHVRRTKLVATIGPACSSYEHLEMLASSGVNIARVNMSHGTHEWYREVIRNCRKLQREHGYGIAVMMDTEGSGNHMGDLDVRTGNELVVDGGMVSFEVLEKVGQT